MLTCVWHALPRLDAGGGGSLTRIPPGQGFGADSFTMLPTVRRLLQNRTTMGPNSTTNGTNLGHGGEGGGEGATENQHKYKKV